MNREYFTLERMTRFELATLTLARLCATTAPHPHLLAFLRALKTLADSSRLGQTDVCSPRHIHTRHPRVPRKSGARTCMNTAELPGVSGTVRAAMSALHRRETGRCARRASRRLGSIRAASTAAHARAIGAVGSALRSHRRGHRFESGIAHRREAPFSQQAERGFFSFRLQRCARRPTR